MKKKRWGEYSAGYGSGEITLSKLVFYNLVFIIPIAIFLFLSKTIAKAVYLKLETTEALAMQITMFFFTLAFFFVIIPIIRRRESIAGVRYALVGFLVVALGLTLPSIIIQKNFWLLFLELPHIASYILLTFIYSPEVLGMDIDISKWFKHYKQLLIIIVYCSIVLLYVMGFGWIYYSMAQDNPGAFSYNIDKPVKYSRYLYFSVITFTTIGYGDITPVSSGARLLVCTEAIVGAIVNVIFIAILFVYISNFQSFLEGIKEEEKKIAAAEERLEDTEAKLKKRGRAAKIKKTSGKNKKAKKSRNSKRKR